ncbi:MAG TPA: hypothetical protein PKD61_31990, partial [Polyangiaceae bacterium]|nr:hypothetical protein [Polyangiaceae bacterium]
MQRSFVYLRSKRPSENTSTPLDAGFPVVLDAAGRGEGRVGTCCNCLGGGTEAPGDGAETPPGGAARAGAVLAARSGAMGSGVLGA